MILDLPPALALHEQDTATLYGYIQYLQSEIERTQTVLRARNLGGPATLTELSTESEIIAGTATQAQPQEARYQTIVEDQLDLICRFQADFRLTFVNEPYAALYGKAPQELIGKNLLSIVPAAYQQQVIDHLTALTAQHPVAVDENPVYLVDGSLRWFQWTNRFLTYADGTIEYQGVGRDITEWKQAEAAQRKQQTAALQTAEAKFQQLFEAAPVAILISNQAGQITLVNQQAEALLGYQAAELLQKPVVMLVPEANRADPPRNRTQFTAELQQHAAGMQVEAVARRKDGSPVPIELQVKYIQTADELLIMSFILDITERKQAADALRRQRDFLQSVIDYIPGVITVKNRQGEFQLSNQYMAQRFGITPATLVGKTSREVNPNQNEVKGLHQAEAQVFATQQPLFIPEVFIGKRYYQVNMLPLPSPTHAEDLVLTVATDITERKQSEVALQQALQTEKELSKLKSGFITTTSHEFRTPLAIILSTVDTLHAYRHKLVDAQIEQRLTWITGQVQRMKTLLDAMLALSEMQARGFNFTPVLCDPASLVHKLITEFQDGAETKRPFVYTCDADLPMAELDERLLRHILNNLLSNAMKYSADDQPVAIHLARSDNALILTVSDKGRGIPATDLKHLFQPFYRATNVETIPGVGLGLSIIKEAVELQRGSITVESQVGVGTTFTVIFPLATNSA